jgi:protein gp37
MAARSSIEWTEATWNPVTGCTKISPGCLNCYAQRMTVRLEAMGQPNYRNGFKVTCHKQTLDLPLHWKKPQMIFVNSMSDLFHKDVPTSFIQAVFAVMNKTRWHCFQVLTKRSERLKQLSKQLPWAKNIWMGVSVENDKHANRISDLQSTGAFVKFLSLEPLLGPVGNLDLAGIDWVIVGGESGPGARPMDADWVLDIRDECIKAHVPFFFKQWGGVRKKEAGRVLDGEIWNEMPELPMGQKQFSLA